MPRGGKRAGAGKPSTWLSKCKFADTKLIRIPKIHAAELLEIAHELDEQETKNMTGTKPFFSGRIPQDLYDAVEKYREESGETKTEVLIRGLSEYIGVKIMATDKPKISSYVPDSFGFCGEYS